MPAIGALTNFVVRTDYTEERSTIGIIRICVLRLDGVCKALRFILENGFVVEADV